MAPAERESIGPFYLIRSVCFEMFVEEKFFHLLQLSWGFVEECIPCILRNTRDHRRGRKEGRMGGHFSIFDDPHVSFNHNQSLGITTQGSPLGSYWRTYTVTGFLLPDWQAGHKRRGLSIQSNIFCFSLRSNRAKRALSKSPDPRNKNIYILNLPVLYCSFPLLKHNMLVFYYFSYSSQAEGPLLTTPSTQNDCHGFGLHIFKSKSKALWNVIPASVS